MKLNKKSLLSIALIAILGYNTYSNEVDVEKKEVAVVERANATVDLKSINKIVQTINFIGESWVGSEVVTKESLYEAALRGIVKSLKDPYSEYLSKKEYEDLNESMDGEYVGVGMSIRKEKGDYLEVISPFIGSPAFKAGIQIGDIITKVDDFDIIDLTATEASQRLRGTENTKVKVELVRKGEKDPLIFTLTREKIKLENVEYKIIDEKNKIGYISLLNFGNKTGDEIKNAVLDLKEKGMEKLIFDLRTNPGGSLQEAVEISSLFVSEELIVSLKTKSGNDKKYNRVGDKIYDGPMVILVNKGSASASEIVTGVLKDYERATVIGQKTYGKGVAQSILMYPNGGGDALKITIAEYSTPKNNNINKNGIEPHIYISMNDLLSIKGYSSETEEAKENRKKEILKSLENSLGKEKAEEAISKGDVQLQAAIDVLLGKEVKSENPNTVENKKTKKDLILEENEKNTEK